MIAVTGATGHLGRLAILALLEQGVVAKDLVAIARTPSKAAALAAKGVVVREGDYSKPATLEAALVGVEKLLLVSSSEVGHRATQHAVVIAAAKKAGVKLVAYTSILHGDRSPLALAGEHLATEQALKASGVPYVLLRNGWYHENYTGNLAGALAHGFAGSAGEGRIAGAARADFAAAAATVLTTPGHEGRAYELGGAAFTMAEYVAEVAKQTGKALSYANLPPDAFRGILVGAGLPAPLADVYVDADVQIAKGALDDSSGDLARLVGRPLVPLSASVAVALAALKA
jgi:NAD(P)H dehydrogenase (quinone)